VGAGGHRSRTLECILGVLYLAWGVVGWQQAGFGIIVAALITIAYTYSIAQAAVDPIERQSEPIQFRAMREIKSRARIAASTSRATKRIVVTRSDVRRARAA